MRATESLGEGPAARLLRPIVVGHRGAPAYRPELTAAGYELAIDLGAAVIEPDIVISRDGALVVRHENELSSSMTFVVRRSANSGCSATSVDKDSSFSWRTTSAPCTGWFAEDFTLAELRTLRAVERMPELRPLNT